MLGLINRWIGAVVLFHNFLYGFRSGRCTGTTSLEEKLLLQLTATRKEFLYKVFLDLKNAYDALDREMCLNILVAYQFSPRTEHLLQKYWAIINMLDRAGDTTDTHSQGLGVSHRATLYTPPLLILW